MPSHVSCVLAWSTCPIANVPKACQRLIVMCQRADVPILQLGVPTCQRRANFSTLPKSVPTFPLLFKKIFNLWIFQLCLTFANFKNIWAIPENLSREIKNLNLDMSKILRKCKIIFFAVEVLKFLSKISKVFFEKHLVFMGP